MTRRMVQTWWQWCVWVRAQAATCMLAALCLLSPACGVSLRAAAVQTTNGVIVAANAGGDVLRQRYCTVTMDAIGRTGVWDGAHCVPSGPHAADPATPAQLHMLDELRAAWRPILAAFDHVADGVDAIADLLAGVTSAVDGRLLEALASLVQAYGAVQRLAPAVGLTLPQLLATSEVH